MDRRELIKMIAAATGAAFVGGTALLPGYARGKSPGGEPSGGEPSAAELIKPKEYRFAAGDVEFLDEVAETIIPRTDTPGAKDARVGQLMTVIVNDCYTTKEQARFHRGMAQLKATSLESYDATFIELSPENRHDLITRLDTEARQYNAEQSEPHYFTMMKQLTLFGFFTSKAGATRVLRYSAVPGHYDGCIPYSEGDRAWAT